MALNFVGNTSLEIGGIPETDIARFDENYASEAARFNTSDGTGWQQTWSAFGTTNLWFHLEMIWDRRGSGISGAVFDFIDNAGNTIFRHDSVANANSAVVGPDGGATNAVNGNTFIPGSDTRYTLDHHLHHDGTKAIFDLYQDGTLVSTASYDTATAPTYDSIFFANINQQEGFGTFPIYMSEMIIADESTLGMRVATLTPGAAGHHTDLTGVPANLTNFADGLIMSSATNLHKSTWTPSTYNGAVGPSSIRGVMTKVRAQRGPTGPQNYRHLMRLSATDYDNGADITPSLTGDVHLWETNPATAVAWSTADFSGWEHGVEIRT